MSRKDLEKPAKKPSAAELRQQRLAEALRANLKRRKASKLTPPPGRPEASEE
jgi:hypothetical protein